MSDQKEFITKIINSFTPNMPLQVKDFVFTEDVYIVYATMYYGHKIPNWKKELINEIEESVKTYTQVPTHICVDKKQFDKTKNRFGYDIKVDQDDLI
jgi:uncharacterized alkaline shock family protein YloU